jgi:TrmH family RNA methyltransferase
MVKKYKRDSEVSYTLGTTLTFELLYNKPNVVKKIYIHPSLKKDETYEKLISLCHKNHIDYEEAIKPFNILSEKDNCYVIGEFSKYLDKVEDTNHVVLVNPSDAGNLGTIMRSSLGFGLSNLIIIEPAVDNFNPKVIRSSMGARFSINVETFSSFDEYIKKYPNRNIYTLMLQASVNLSELETKQGNYSIVFGNEATGLPREFLNIGTPVIIKHSNKIDCLNLPIAVSITLYEFTKERFK